MPQFSTAALLIRDALRVCPACISPSMGLIQQLYLTQVLQFVPSVQIFYPHYLHNVPIHPIDGIVKIRCAQGEAISYWGYINVTVNTVEIDTASNNDCLMLVVLTTQYSQKVPAIIETNFPNSIINSIHQQNGERFLQHTKMTTPWYIAFRCVGLKEKELQRTNNRLGVVKSAENNDIIIPQNNEVRVSVVTLTSRFHTNQCVHYYGQPTDP